ncbi:hypothetical protein [Acinetobacter variabilis]|uniref:hypothetical protein n=1 Tax=Acinetobacter variabilis TaxID=70346 RepID=UPI0028973F87|nr:hypothetical protein [Acinetobacter variabilis]
MLKNLMLATVLGISLATQAGLVSLDPQQMTAETGQGGADLSWTLSLNHQYATDLTKSQISETVANKLEVYYKPTTDCGINTLFCRLAISPNNHVDAQGNKKWLVFKGIQGTLQIDKFSIDGTTITNAAGDPQTAMKITFYDDKPLKIRNLGFNTLAIETGTGEGDKEGYANSEKYTTFTNRVYQADGTYTTASADVPEFDRGREKGFMGLNMHGNMHMSGNLKIFGFNCSAGSAQSRC